MYLCVFAYLTEFMVYYKCEKWAITNDYDLYFGVSG